MVTTAVIMPELSLTPSPEALLNIEKEDNLAFFSMLTVLPSDGLLTKGGQPCLYQPITRQNIQHAIEQGCPPLPQQGFRTWGQRQTRPRVLPPHETQRHRQSGTDFQNTSTGHSQPRGHRIPANMNMLNTIGRNSSTCSTQHPPESAMIPTGIFTSCNHQ